MKQTILVVAFVLFLSACAHKLSPRAMTGWSSSELVLKYVGSPLSYRDLDFSDVERITGRPFKKHVRVWVYDTSEGKYGLVVEPDGTITDSAPLAEIVDKQGAVALEAMKNFILQVPDDVCKNKNAEAKMECFNQHQRRVDVARSWITIRSEVATGEKRGR